MRRPFPAPDRWIPYPGPHPSERTYPDGPLLQITWWLDPDTGDLWRTSITPEQVAPAAVDKDLGRPEWLTRPHLILDLLIVDGVEYRVDRRPNYKNFKIPTLVI